MYMFNLIFIPVLQTTYMNMLFIIKMFHVLMKYVDPINLIFLDLHLLITGNL